MSLFARLLQAVRSWRRRRGGPKTVRYAGIAMEQLDHRQLLSVNFTGNVPIDFPATQSPGVVVLPDNPLVHHPAIALRDRSDRQGLGVRHLGDPGLLHPRDDTLSIGLDQPPSQNQPGAVIAGDADNNGNSGTVNPAVTAVPGFAGFQDPANFRRHRAHGGLPRLHGQRQRPDRRRLLGRAPHAHRHRPRPRSPTRWPSPSRPGPTPPRRSAPSCPSSRATSTTTTPPPIPNLEFDDQELLPALPAR